MKPFPFGWAAACLGVMLGAAPAIAATPLTLQEALSAGLRQNPEVRRAEINMQLADVALSSAQAERLTYSGDLAVGDRFGVLGLLGTDPLRAANEPIANATVMARVPLFTGYRITHQITQAEAGTELGRARITQARQDLIWNVTQAYWQARRAELRAGIQLDALDKAKQARDIVKTSMQIGRASANELDRVEVSLLNTESELLRARDDEERARAQLGTLIQRDMAGVTLSDPPSLAAAPVVGQEQALATALSQRPDMRLAQAQLAMNTAAVDVARADRLPQVEFITAYQHGNNPFIATSQNRSVLNTFVGAWDARLNLSYHLFDNGVINRNVGSRELETAGAEVALTAARRTAELEVRQALTRLDLAKRRIGLGERSVSLATKNLQYIESRFKFGYALLVELNEARTTLVNSRNQRVDAQIDHQLAIAALQRAMGTLEAPTASAPAAP